MEKENYQMHGQASQDSSYRTKGHLMGTHGPGGWGPPGIPLTGGGGLRVPNLRVCKHPLTSGVAHEGEEWRINVLPWNRRVGLAVPPVSRKGGRTQLPQG